MTSSVHAKHPSFDLIVVLSWVNYKYSHISDNVTDEIDEKVLEANATMATITATATSNVLNLSVFLSTID